MHGVVRPTVPDPMAAGPASGPDAIRTPRRSAARGVVVGLGAAGVVALGLVAERVAFDWSDAADWLPDLLVGWTISASGLVAWLRRPQSRIGAMLVAAGVAWFAGNFASADWWPAGWLGAHLLYLHRGPLIQCVLSFPTGRLSGWFARAVGLAGYLTAVVTPLGRSNLVTLVLGLLVAASGTWSHVRAVGPERRARARSAPAAVLLGVALAAVACMHLAYPAGEADAMLLLIYEAVLVIVAITLTTALVGNRWEYPSVTDLVVAVAEGRSGTLQDALARALGDPSLQIGYRIPHSDAYADADGHRVDLTHVDPTRGVTPVVAGEQQVAVLVHDAAVLRDVGLLRSVASATELEAANARLRGEVQAKLAELAASRRRLVRAGDEERRRLDLRLRAGVESRLMELAADLQDIQKQAEDAAVGALLPAIDRAQQRLGTTVADLRQLARGLHPRALTDRGLGAAIHELAARARLEVSVALPADDVPPDLAAAAYFVCAEALTNAEKHAGAAQCSIAIEREPDRLVVRVVDDGVGGADLARGSGLRGLADRVEAMGGTLAVDSAPRAGTTVSAVFPVTSGAGQVRRSVQACS